MSPAQELLSSPSVVLFNHHALPGSPKVSGTALEQLGLESTAQDAR